MSWLFAVVLLRFCCLALGDPCQAIMSGMGFVIQHCSVEGDLLIDATILPHNTSGRSVWLTDIAVNGGSIIILGWNDSITPFGDTFALSIAVSEVDGHGRLLISGYFPNKTTVNVQGIDLAYNSSCANISSPVFGCSGPSSVSSTVCLYIPSLTFTIHFGFGSILENTWDPVASGNPQAVVQASSVLCLVTNLITEQGLLFLGQNTLYHRIGASTSPDFAAAVIVYHSQGSIIGDISCVGANITVDGTNFNSIPPRISAFVVSTTASTILTLRSSFSFIGGVVRLFSVSSAQLLDFNGTRRLLLWASSRLEVSGLSADISGVTSTTLLSLDTIDMRKLASLTVANCTTRLYVSSGNASFVEGKVVGRFASSIAIIQNSAFLEAPNGSAHFSVVSASLTTNAQLLIGWNFVTIRCLDPYAVAVYFPTRHETVNVSSYGAMFVVHNNFSFDAAILMPSMIDGPFSSTDSVVFIKKGGSVKILGNNISGSSLVKFSFTNQNRYTPEVSTEFTFIIGCLGVNDVYPAYALALYSNPDIVDSLTASVNCECSPEWAFAPTLPTNDSGQFPDCSFECVPTSLSLSYTARRFCSAPFVFTASATITSKTMPPLMTLTTYTEYVSPTKRSRSLTSSNSPRPSTSALPFMSATASRSRTPVPTSTHTLGESSATETVTKIVTVSRSEFTFSDYRTSTLSLTTVASLTHLMSTTRSLWNSVSTTASKSVAESTATLAVTRRTSPMSASKAVATVSWTASKTPILTASRYVHSRTLTFKAPPEPFRFLLQSQALGFLTLVLSCVSSLLSGYPSVFHTQFIAVIGQSQSTGVNAHQRTLPMAYILSPFWDFGAVAVAVGNVLLIFAFFGLHFGATKLNVIGRFSGTQTAQHPTTPEQAPAADVDELWAVHRFPEMSFSFACLFYQGACCAAFNIFYHYSGPAFVIGTVGILFAIALPLLLYWVVYGFLKAAMPAYREVSYGSHTLRHFFPHGYWSSGKVKRAFGRLFSSTTQRSLRVVGYTMLTVILVNAASSARADTKQERDGQFGILGLLFLVSGLFIAVVRPHRSYVTNAVFCLSYALLMMLCVCLANEETNEGAANGVPAVIIILEVLLWMNSVYEVASWVAESRGLLHRIRKQAVDPGTASGPHRTAHNGDGTNTKQQSNKDSYEEDLQPVPPSPVLRFLFEPPINSAQDSTTAAEQSSVTETFSPKEEPPTPPPPPPPAPPSRDDPSLLDDIDSERKALAEDDDFLAGFAAPSAAPQKPNLLAREGPGFGVGLKGPVVKRPLQKKGQRRKASSSSDSSSSSTSTSSSSSSSDSSSNDL